ncbi:MAG: hypothetical protein M3021_00160 [Actinomycetota bacterium]|nr:hypothetical protein [Actinomycetota bacterium]
MLDAPTVPQAARRIFPAYGWVGLGLIALGEMLILTHWRPLSDYWFAAIWFGVIALADAVIYRRDGSSLLMSQRRDLLLMLPLSAAGWWMFEFANLFVQNWHYLQPSDIPEWWKQVWASIFFSTVIPAEFEAAMLLWPLGWVRHRRGARPMAASRLTLWLLPAMGLAWFLLAVSYPLYAYPLIWGSLALVLDPINMLRGRPSILGYLARGDWRTPVALYAGGQLCGIMWEFWNYWAFPKWEYTIPWVGFWKIFEMPLLGYIGYGPFAWEVFALYHFVRSFWPGLRLMQGTDDDGALGGLGV